MPTADPLPTADRVPDLFADDAADARPDTVRFPPPDPARHAALPAAATPPPTAAQSLAKIDARLGELVRLLRLALGLAAAWLLWTVFGGGIAWLTSAATWAAGIAVCVAVLTGVAAYLSPRVRRSLKAGVRGLLGAIAGRAAGRG